MTRVIRCIVLLAMLCLLCASASAEGVNRALLVGCDRFLTAEDTSPSSANNVTQMAAALSGGAMNLRALTTRRSGISGVDELAGLIAETFAGADAGDVSYFYISTHGVWQQNQPNDRMTLLLSDGAAEEGLTARRLRELFDQVPGTKVLIIDACHSGAMIGKGVQDPFYNIFAGSDYKVLCSSGGAEESWFWAGPESLTGEGYFSGALTSALAAWGGYAADDNRDGVITLSELRRYLRQNHGASTVQCYPEEDDFAFLTYDADAFTGRRRDSVLENIAFETSALSPEQPEASFSFTMLRSARIAYQLVYQRAGCWDFENAVLQWDNSERFGAYGDTPGWLSPGFKERTISLLPENDDSFGYVLLQVLAVQEDEVSVAASQVLCVPPVHGDPRLSVNVPGSFFPSLGDELTFVVDHAFPCELTVIVETPDGQPVRRLCSRQATRPEQLLPTGSTFVWNGCLADGAKADDGLYRLHIKAYVGDVTYECWSDAIALLAPAG